MPRKRAQGLSTAHSWFPKRSRVGWSHTASAFVPVHAQASSTRLPEGSLNCFRSWTPLYTLAWIAANRQQMIRVPTMCGGEAWYPDFASVCVDDKREWFHVFMGVPYERFLRCMVESMRAARLKFEKTSQVSSLAEMFWMAYQRHLHSVQDAPQIALVDLLYYAIKTHTHIWGHTSTPCPFAFCRLDGFAPPPRHVRGWRARGLFGSLPSIRDAGQPRVDRRRSQTRENWPCRLI